MDDELAIIQSAKDKMALRDKKKDVAILRQVLEPIEEAMGELKEAIQESTKGEKKEVAYFDKDFNSKLAASLDKVFNLISKLKSPDVNIDLSPIASIASEIKKGNDNIIDLIKQSNSGNTSGELFRMITAMVGKQNAFIEKGFSQIDYSDKIDELIKAVNTKDKIEDITFIYNENGSVIKKAVATYKK